MPKQRTLCMLDGNAKLLKPVVVSAAHSWEETGLIEEEVVGMAGVFCWQDFADALCLEFDLPRWPSQEYCERVLAGLPFVDRIPRTSLWRLRARRT